jgi:hypothetical protein
MVRDGVTWFGPQTANVTVTVVSAAPQVAPTCSSVAPSVTTTNATTGSLRVYAYGVSNATSVFFPTWGDTGGQDDIGWYQGINAGNGTWYADVNLANHKAGNPEFGTFNTHVHMHNAAYSYVWCGATNWTRTAPTPAALCALALSVPLQLTPAENISWAGCGNTGVGVQSALDLVTSLGGGEVKLTGAGSILVGSPLKVGNRTLVYGDLSRLPYGMQLIGNQCGGSPIQRECPVISINSQSISGTSNNNVEIRNIEIAAHPTYPNRGEVISIRESNRVLLENVKIDGAVRMGVAVYRSANVAIRNLNLTMVRWPSQPSLEGGAGVWIFGSTNTLLENSTITSPEYYASGLPKPDPRSAVTAALTMDLVAAYASQGTRIQGNTITYGNTAGIYIACQADTAGCETARTARDVGAVVWNNTVRFFRQHGLDIASSDGTQVVTNRVSDIGDAALALADVTQSTVQYNTLERAQLNAQPHSLRGTLLLLWGAKNNNITYNTVVGDTNTEYAVAFSDSGSAAFGFCTSNNVSSNNLWRGRLGHIGGTLSGNVVSPNQTY